MSRRVNGDGGIFRDTTHGGWRGYIPLPGGKRKYFHASTQAAARDKRRELLQQRDGVGIIVGRTPTLGAWITHWIERTKDDHKPRVTSNYKHLLNLYIGAKLRNTHLDRLTPDDIEANDAALEKRGLSVSIRRQTFNLIHVALKSAVRRGHISHNVSDEAEGIPSLHQSKAPDLVLSEVDIAALMPVLEASSTGCRWMVGLSLGLRPAEALGLEWKHIDLENAVLSVRQQVQEVDGHMQIIPMPKTAAGRRDIPLPEFLVQALQKHRAEQAMALAGVKRWSPDGEPHSWVFTSQVKRGKPLTASGDRAQWIRLLGRAGIPSTRRYTARHTAASILIAHGVDAVTVAAILGHADAGFTMRTYVHALDERKINAAKVLDGIHDVQVLAEMEV